MNTKKIQPLLLGLLSFPLCFSSCIDNDYDLEDVDKTLGIETDLTLPTSSTGDVTLKSIMELEDDGVVQTIDGDFYLVEDGVADIEELTIDPISIPSPKVSFIETYVDLNPATQGVNGVKRKAGSQEDDGVFCYTIQDKDNAYYEASASSSGHIADEIISIENITFAGDNNVSLKINVNVPEGYEHIKILHYDDFVLEVPKGLNVSKAVYTCITAAGKTTEVLPDVNIDNKAGTVRVTPEKDVKGNLVGQDAMVTLTIDKALVGQDITFADHKAELKGRFTLNGAFRLERSEMGEIPVEKLLEYEQGNRMAITPDHVTINGSAWFEREDITVKTFTGTVQKKVEGITPIQLNDLPNFLNDDEVVLDLKKVAAFLRISNPFPQDFTTGITLRSCYDNQADVARHTGQVVVPAGQETVFCLCDDRNGIKWPDQYNGLAREIIIVDDLKALLKRIPREVKVDVDDIRMECKDMKAEGTYKVDADYCIFTPLEFGEEFKLVYSDTEDGLAVDMEDLEDINVDEITLSAEAVSTLPLDLSLEIIPLDKDKNVIRNLQVTQLASIKANGTTPVKFGIKATENHTINESLSGKDANGRSVPQLDAIRYRAVAASNGSSNGILNENASLRLEKIKIRVAGKFTYDANDDNE